MRQLQALAQTSETVAQLCHVASNVSAERTLKMVDIFRGVRESVCGKFYTVLVLEFLWLIAEMYIFPLCNFY